MHRKLEEAMDARIVAVIVNTEELSQNVSRPSERVEVYASSAGRYPGYVRPTLWDESREILRTLCGSDDFHSRIGKYMTLMQAVGPYGADYWVLNELDLRVKAATSGYDAALMDLSRRFSSPVQNSESQHLDAAREVAERHRERFSDEVIVEESWLSPKMLKLVELLQQAKSRTDTFQGIIFTQQRSIAAAVSWMLSRIPRLQGWVKCSVVMGHGSTNAPSMKKHIDGMQFKLQHEIIEKFRRHEINLLVATNVAEEGLDFKASPTHFWKLLELMG
jgi:endoribonuclease Dicer